MSFRVCLSLVLLLSPVLTDASSAEVKSSVGTKARSPRPSLRNVELTAAGALDVQVIDTSGIPLGNVKVAVQHRDQNVMTVTNSEGRISVPDLRGGTCLMQVDDRTYACRVWQHGTAPPRSLQSIALVNGDPSLVRGNRFRRGNACPQDGCDPCEDSGGLSCTAQYGLAITALVGTAAYFALSRDNASD